MKPAVISLVSSAKELRDYNCKAFEKVVSDETRLALTHDQQSRFDRSAVIELLKRKPESFAAPQARTDSRGINDGGGAIRALIDQLDINLPFGLDLGFYLLLIDKSDKACGNSWGSE